MHAIDIVTANDLVHDRFHHVLDDPAVKDPSRIRRVLLCSGKVYYDLVAHREKAGTDDTAIVRVEQLFPFREESIQAILDRYAKRESLLWVQEEPKNMGAYRHIDAIFRDRFDVMLPYVGREANASPAVASMKMHLQEQEAIMIRALGLASDGSKVASLSASSA